MEPKIITTKEAAGIVERETKTLERWRKEKVGPPYIGEGKSIRYRDDLCLKWKNGSRALEGKLDQFPPIPPSPPPIDRERAEYDAYLSRDPNED